MFGLLLNGTFPSPYRTPGLLVVLAVAAAAVIHEVEHVGERPLDAVARQPQADCAHPGGVDEPTLTRQVQ